MRGPGITLALVAIVATPALAGQTITGDYIQIHYSDQGTWNWPAAQGGPNAGLTVRDSFVQPFVDISYLGTPFQEIVLEYDHAASFHYYSAAMSASSFGGIAQQNLSSGSSNVSSYVYAAGAVSLRKTEVWDDGARVVYVGFQLTNTSASNVTNLRLMHSLDPDFNAAANTSNDVHSDGLGWVGASALPPSPVTGWTLGYGKTLAADEIGFTNPWTSDADAALLDPNAAGSDSAMHWRHRVATLAPGQSASAEFILAFDTTEATARSEYLVAYPTLGAVCDADQDGHFRAFCGGSDCLDASAATYPGAPELVGDGQDQDCDAVDACYEDLDDDGFGTDVVVEDDNLDCDDASALTASQSGDACPDDPSQVSAPCATPPVPALAPSGLLLLAGLVLASGVAAAIVARPRASTS